MKLNDLSNYSRPFKRTKRLGRGIGSKSGKTSGRGQKGAGSRSGWKSRARYEGGQLPLYRKMPERGFNNIRFSKKYATINLRQIDEVFEDGEVVNLAALRTKGFLKTSCPRLKILADGELAKKVTIEAHSYSEKTMEKLNASGVDFKVVA